VVERREAIHLGSHRYRKPGVRVSRVKLQRPL
jgi:hypothetical protein